MYKRSFWIVLVLLLGSGIWWLQAAPPPATPEDTAPTISWSVTKLTSTMFPGTSSTTIATFRSDQNLAGVVVEATSSLDGIVSVNPASFPSIIANQNYQLTFTLKAPLEFKKRSFGGTIHIHNDGKPPKTYAKPLKVGLRTDWSSTSTAMGVVVNYPVGWTPQPLPGGSTDVFTNNSSPGPLSDASLTANSFFQIRLLGPTPGQLNPSPANPSALPITQWFVNYFAAGFSVPPSSQSVISVGGRQVVKIELVEVGGLRVHVYIPRGQDVFEVSYGLFAPAFVPTYELMLNSLQL